MAINMIGDKVRAHLLNTFGGEQSSPAAKISKTSSASTDGSKRAVSPSRIPFDKPQTKWLQNMLADTCEVIGVHVEERITTLETQVAEQQRKLSKIDDLELQVKDLTQKIEAMKVQVEDVDIKHTNEVNRVEARIDSAGGSHQQAANGLVGSNNEPIVAVPYELRTVAVIGNLGWDTPKALLLERAGAVLTQAGIDPSDHTSPSAVTGKDLKGSRVELRFHTPERLQSARLAVRALGKTFTEGERKYYVWLDAKKEKNETKPRRIVHRMAECLEDVEAGRDDKLDVTKVLNTKFIKVGPHRVGYVFKSEWKFTRWGIDRYSDEIREMATAYAEGE